MKRSLVALFLFLLFSSFSMAQDIGLSGAPTIVEEVDGSPSSPVHKIIVPNGSVTVSGGAATINVAGPGTGVTGGNSHDHNGGDGAAIPDAALSSGTTVVSAGAADSGKLIKLDAEGKADESVIKDSDIDHGLVGGLADDDHPQYHNDTRGDVRYFQKAEHLNTSAGATDAGKPVKLDADGQIDATMINDGDVSYTGLSGVPTTASQAEIEAGTESTVRMMTPLRDRQGIESALQGTVVKTIAQLDAAIAAIPMAIYVAADLTLDGSKTIPSGTVFQQQPGAIVTTHTSVAGGGAAWTLHAGSVYKLDAAIGEPSFLWDLTTGSPIALTEVAGSADIDAAGKWAWEGGYLYVRTTGSVDPDTLAADTLKVGYVLTINKDGVHGATQRFEAYAGEVVFNSVSGSIWGEWFGAKGDAGVTDNQNPISVGIHAAVVLGAPYLLGPGEFHSSGTIAINAINPSAVVNKLNHIIIQGAGCPDVMGNGNPDLERQGGTVIQFTNADGTHGITYSPTGPTNAMQSALSIRDIEIRGSGNSSGDGLRLIGDGPANGVTIRVDLQNLSVNNFGGGNGIYLYFCENGSGRNVTVNRNSTGLRLEGASNANQWYNLISQYNKEYGIYATGCTTNAIFGGLVQENDKTGIYWSGVDEFSIYGMHFESNNTTHTAGKHALHIQGVDGLYNGANTINTCRFANSTYDTVYLQGVATGTTGNTVFVNCRSLVSVGNSMTIADAYCYYTKVDSFGGTISDSGTQSDLPDLGWRTWTPSFSGAVISGYTSARYVSTDNRTIHFVFDAENVSITGAGNVGITLPVAVGASANGYAVLLTDVNDGSAWVGKVHTNITANATTFSVYKNAAAASWAGGESGVSIRVSGTYEVDWISQ